MASESERRRWAVVVLASLSTALLFYFGTGLDPKWFLTWLAPLPVLFLAPRVNGRSLACAAFIGYVLGTMNIAGYYLTTLELPVPFALGMFVVTSAIFAGAAVAYRALALRQQLLLAAATFASVVVSAEYAIAMLVPGGANWSLAPTQAELLPVLQLASLIGIWGISFLVLAVPAAVAAILAPGVQAPRRIRAASVAGVVIVASLAYGFVQLNTNQQAPTVRVTLVAARLPAPEPILDVGTAGGQRLLEADLAALADVPAATEIVVFPEKDLLVDEAAVANLSDRFAAAAREYQFTIVVGVERHAGDARFNEAMIFSPDNHSSAVYQKQFMLPGLEDGFTAGQNNVFVDGDARRIGVAICADMGHPQLGRSYGRDGARAMIVPALDFTEDARSQSRVQYLRGVENGYSIARAARLGFLTLTDPNGRIISEAPADTDKPVAMVSGELPMPSGTTLYTRWGDWFAWLSMLIVTVGLGCIVRLSRRDQEPAREHTDEAMAVSS